MSDTVLRIEGLEKSFSELKVLKGVDLEIRRGEVVCVIGASGSGKSTLLRCVNLLEEADAGRILFEGQDLMDLSVNLNALRQKIGMVFQSFNLFNNKNVLDNCTLAPMSVRKIPKAQAEETAKKHLTAVGLQDFIYADATRLSGGQKQRVAIARALASDPKVLLCDEATSALDPQTTRSILALLKDLNRKLGVTVVVITHEMRVVEQICSHVAILDKGQIQESGPVAEVFANPRTEAGRRLVMPEDDKIHVLPANRLVRLVFNGLSVVEPVIATLAKEQGICLNIIAADTRSIGAKTYGSMVLALPLDETDAARALIYLRDIEGVTAEEVTDYVQ